MQLATFQTSKYSKVFPVYQDCLILISLGYGCSNLQRSWLGAIGTASRIHALMICYQVYEWHETITSKTTKDPV